MNRKDALFIIEQTVKAPSGHNTQPWLFGIDENYIRIYPDISKCLPIVDPDNRELFVSLGCAVENFFWAAQKRGYNVTFDIRKDGEVFAILTCAKEKNDSVLEMFNQISVRQTNRKIYSGEKISSDIIGVLESVSWTDCVKVHLFPNRSDSFDLLKNYIVNGNTIQLRDKVFKNELKKWMRYNYKHAMETKDGLSYSVFGAPDLPRFVSELVMEICLNPLIQNRSDSKKIESSSHFTLFTVSENDIINWIMLGRVLQRFLLKATQCGIACAFMNQPCEIAELSVTLRQNLFLSGYPVILLRVGYALPAAHSLRRPLSCFIKD